jgi:glycosyltransferase involved in cell wall biosynthesis
MNSLKFSIILPTYNRAEMIQNAINSVLKQTYKDWELIIIDDGSTDNTKNIVDKYKKEDQRIKYFFQKNQERSIARNNGISKSSAIWICFLDSDDYYEENHLEELSLITPKNSEVLIVTGFYNVINSEKIKGVFPKFEKNMVDYFFKNSVIPARVCVHRNIVKKFKFNPKITIGEDSILWSNICTKFPIKRGEFNTVLYNIHEENSVNIKNFCSIKELQGLNFFFKTETANFLTKRRKREMKSDCYYKIGLSYKYHKKNMKFILLLLVSIFFNPFQKSTKSKVFEILSCFYIFKNIWKMLKG